MNIDISAFTIPLRTRTRARVRARVRAGGRPRGSPSSHATPRLTTLRL